MAQSDALTAGSSPAEPVKTVDFRPLESMNEAEREHWQLTGEYPAPADEAPPRDEAPQADPPPAEPAEQATSTEVQAPPASEPGKPPRRNADSRIQELLAERAELRRRLEALEQDRPRQRPDDHADSAPAPAPPTTFPSYDDWLLQPGKQGGLYDTYNRELARFEAAQVWTELSQQQRLEAERSERTRTFKGRFDAVAAADPAYMASLSPEVLDLLPVESLRDPSQATMENVLASEIVAAEHGPALLQHLSQHPEDFRALVMAPSPLALGRLLARIESTLVPASAPAAAVVRQPVVSQAPPPPATLGRKPTPPINESEAAVARRDVGAYIEAENRRQMKGA